jgi:UDP-N-acetylmuramoyl-tripeptide--D-alanyl-D-alanine ligase
MITLGDVTKAISGSHPIWANQIISEVVIDSRQAIRGSLFIALPGEHVDGHDFVHDAFERGASLALVNRDFRERFTVLDLRNNQAPDVTAAPDFPCCVWVDDCLVALQQIAHFWRRQFQPKVIGITGSVGKTTTKEIVTEVLRQRYRTLKNTGNLNNEIGLPLTLLSLNESYDRAVLEMGFYVPGEINLLCDLAMPQIGVITNIGTVHAERAGSQEAIAQGKAELVEALPPDPDGVAILNYDDPRVRAMASLTKARIFFYGLSPEADLWADHVNSLGLDGIQFRLHYRNETLHLKVPLIGRHSVHTSLRAAAVGLVDGLTWQEIVAGLRSERAQLRLSVVTAKSGALMLDDTYNASPESSLAALNLLNEMEGHKVAVLGDMLELGPYEHQGHVMVGVRAAQVADELVTVGKLGEIIASSARKSGLPADLITTLEDSESAIEYLRERLDKKDVVLVKGSRGMDMDKIVAALEMVS